MGGSRIFKLHASVPPYLGSPPPNPELKDLIDLQVGDWYRLGLSLNLKSDDLNIIEEDHRRDTRKQTCKMFDHWLKAQPDASYEQLIKALHKVGDETVANSLRKKYGKYEIFIPFTVLITEIDCNSITSLNSSSIKSCCYILQLSVVQLLPVKVSVFQMPGHKFIHLP